MVMTESNSDFQLPSYATLLSAYQRDASLNQELQQSLLLNQGLSSLLSQQLVGQSTLQPSPISTMLSPNYLDNNLMLANFSLLVPNAPEQLKNNNILSNNVMLLPVVGNQVGDKGAISAPQAPSADTTTKSFSQLSSSIPAVAAALSRMNEQDDDAKDEVVPFKNQKSCDVLFGRGMSKHPGNVRLHKLIESLAGPYDEAHLGEKIELSRAVVVNVQENGGRFLRRNEETSQWEEVSNSKAREKVAHAFRNLRRRKVSS